jgi:hypothetical protein
MDNGPYIRLRAIDSAPAPTTMIRPPAVGRDAQSACGVAGAPSVAWRTAPSKANHAAEGRVGTLLRLSGANGMEEAVRHCPEVPTGPEKAGPGAVPG